MKQKSRGVESLVVARSEEMRAVLEKVDALSGVRRPALIEGEPGTGRELVARVLHERSGSRKPLVFSSGAASNLFLSDDIDISDQRYICREAGTYVVRDAFCLSQASLPRLQAIMDADGGPNVVALADCAYREGSEQNMRKTEFFATFAQIRIPPLRDRFADIGPLAVRLIGEHCADIGRPRPRLSTRAIDRLVRYGWPGNLVELAQVTRRLSFRCGARIEAADVESVLPNVIDRVPMDEMAFEDFVEHKANELLRKVGHYGIDNLYSEIMHRVEKPLLKVVLEHTGGNQVQAAEVLGLNRNTLRRKLKDYNLKQSNRMACKQSETSVAKVAKKKLG